MDFQIELNVLITSGQKQNKKYNMKQLQSFDEFINESMTSKAEWIRFAEKIFDNGYDTLNISLKYATKADSVFNDGHKKNGKKISSTEYIFKDEDDFSYFVEELLQSGIPMDEIELS